MIPHTQSQEFGWLIIRLTGLIITIYAVYHLFSIAYINHTLQENLSNLKEFFPGDQLIEHKKKIILLPLIIYSSYLVFGIYCLRGGGFLHQLLFYRSTSTKTDVAIKINSQKNFLEPDEDKVTEKSSNQKELFRKFIIANPRINELNDKDKHRAFREWLNQ